ncbi:MAG: hypothetical protein Q8Q31_05360 [Nanoarchaeota archaeon]|nr:hypothetical protein [Nanoarchaeota archaeon]
MKLLASSGQNTLESRVLVRDTAYRIRNIAAPLPSAMTPEDYERGEIMVISHPGWRRTALAAESMCNANDFIDMVQDILKKRGIHKHLNSRDLSFFNNQLAKLAFLRFDRLKYFYEELKTESALDLAREKDIPVILTVPCEELGSHDYLAIESPTVGFVPYLNGQIMRGQRTYVLPTYPLSGRILGDDGNGLEESLEFESSEKGRKIFGGILEYSWKNIYFAGGQIKNCLRGTMSYFAKKKNIRLIDDYCFTSKNGFNGTFDLAEISISAISLLLNPRFEKKARQALLKLFEPFDPLQMRAREYQRVFRVFNTCGLRTDNYQGNPDSQVRIVKLRY